MKRDRWEKIEELYHSALERNADDRAAYLREACGGDEALRREVQSLLLQEQRGNSFLEEPAIRGLANGMSADASQSLIGLKVGSYQVIALLGAGGMGEVYEARDTKLGRNVAIKVLPKDFAHDAGRLARFQREAKMLASLNHPNIATIHGLEESEGIQYLVMELVPGETLAERVKAGAIPVKEALKIAEQISEALEAAHEKGIIHRDLKPANVKVTPEGRVKVLDFGLAKAFVGEDGQDLSNAATLTFPGTEEGRVLGTPPYMSPEQARGKPVDKRTDIWAFGCVLYELLTGKQAFGGETLSDTIAVVLEREPDWQALPATTPEKIRDLLRRCLQKLPRSRLHDIADARTEIEEALAAPATEGPKSSVEIPKRAGWRRAIVWVITSLLVAVVIGLVLWERKASTPTTSALVSRIAITLPPSQPLAGLVPAGSALAISPDGTRLAYVASVGGTQQLYVRALEGLETKSVPGSEGATVPFFSPDSQWIGFFAGGKLKKMALNSGETMTVTDAPDARGASWNSQGTIVFAPTRASNLQHVSSVGGPPQAFTQFGSGEDSHRWPEFLPGGKAVLFAALNSGANWNDAQIAVESTETGTRHNLIQGGTNPRYAASGHLVYARGGILFALPFDLRRLETMGQPVAVVEGVVQSQLIGAAQYSFSSTGSLVYVPTSVQVNQRRLVWISRNGAELPLPAPPRPYRRPRLSPDGRQVAVAIEEQEAQIWLYDTVRDALMRLTRSGHMNLDPLWTPDGKRIVFHSTYYPNDVAGADAGLFWQLADGSGGAERLSDFSHTPSSLSPDGQVLALSTASGPGGIFLMQLSDRRLKRFFESPYNAGSPRFSPNGRWLAYTSDESGRYEIYVQPFPGPGGKLQISTEGGTEPVWNPNGRELFYRSGDAMMDVEITMEPNLSAGKPKVLFRGQYQPSPILDSNYDVSPDGQRFLMLKPTAQEQPPTQINVVLNWFEELKQKVPTGKK